MIDVAVSIDDPFYRRVIGQQADPGLANALFQQAGGGLQRDALTGLVFHRTHPADVDRLLYASQQLKGRSGSAFYGDPGASSGSDAIVWQLLKQRICNEAQANIP